MNEKIATAEKTRVALLGVGAMGARMAQRLLQAGYSVTLYNRNPARAQALLEQGGVCASSPREAAARADIVMSMVRDDEASAQLWCDPDIGALYGLSEGAVAIESSSLTPRWTSELARRVEALGAQFLAAPVVGSRAQAQAGQLVYLVGGDADALAKVRPVLSVMGCGIHHVGRCDNAMAMKLLVNVLFGVQVAALGEMLGFARAAGIGVQRAVDILNTLALSSPALQGLGHLISRADYAPSFPIDLVEKDFDYALTCAQALGVDTPTCAAVHGVYTRACEAGYAQDNIAGVAQLYLAQAGLSRT